jgi:fumarate reductase iron-sulfur subunit
MAGSIEVSLWRGKADGRYQAFSVPLLENQTVLDVVTWVQRHADPTLAYRFACRVGMCGSCAMTVNGRPRWTCRTHISKVIEDGRVEIGARHCRSSRTSPAICRSSEMRRLAGVPLRQRKSRQDPDRTIRRRPRRVAADAPHRVHHCAVCYSACDTVRY